MFRTVFIQVGCPTPAIELSRIPGRFRPDRCRRDRSFHGVNLGHDAPGVLCPTPPRINLSPTLGESPIHPDQFGSRPDPCVRVSPGIEAPPSPKISIPHRDLGSYIEIFAEISMSRLRFGSTNPFDGQAHPTSSDCTRHGASQVRLRGERTSAHLVIRRPRADGGIVGRKWTRLTRVLRRANGRRQDRRPAAHARKPRTSGMQQHRGGFQAREETQEGGWRCEKAPRCGCWAHPRQLGRSGVVETLRSQLLHARPTAKIHHRRCLLSRRDLPRIDAVCDVPQRERARKLRPEG